ncbi:MAG: HD-GYP domain-containing protein [Betaproteobacteria bacterium]|nr:HD-GYP domain-containing protein [Betaproteobacteria bacterium]
MSQKVLSKDIKIGMFIADLDRPWIDTPFLLQGFMVEDDEQLQQLRQHCQWVIIDPQRSAGPEFETPVKKFTPAPRDVGEEPRVIVNRAQAPRPVDNARPATPRVPLPAATNKRPEPKPTSNATREIAIPVERGRSSSTSSAEIYDSALNAGNRRPDGESSGGKRGLWGQLREGVSGLFARKQEDHYDFDSVEPEPTPPKDVSIRPAFVPETVQLTIYEDAKVVEEEIGAATAAFERTNNLLHSVVEDIRSGNTLELQAVEEVIEDMVESMVRNPDALMWVARMREQDLNVYGHGLAVAISLVAFGRHLGYPKDQLSHLGLMGLLLDIGKIKLPRELLEKTSRLSSEEFEQIKEHVELGLAVLQQTPNMHPDVIEGIAQHHERMNGTGYPNNLMGDKISVFGRMCAIADTYAAVTKARPYAEAMSPHEALQMLSTWSGTQFHSDMVEQFIQSIGVFPVGSLVELSSGEVGVIVTHNKLKRLRPKVLVIAEADKTPCRHPAMRDLLYDVSDNPTYIRKGLPSNAFGLDPSEYYLS